MLLKKLAPALAVLGALFFAGASHADAAPTFLLPDTTFSSTSTSSFTLGSSSPLSYTLNIGAGSSIATDFGMGYSSTPGTITVSGNVLTVTTSVGSYTADISHSYSNKSIVGIDVVSTAKVTSSTMTGVNVGGFVLVDLHVFNYTNGQGAVKGDVAPVVPEPASLSLLLLGTLGAAGAVRRRTTNA